MTYLCVIAKLVPLVCITAFLTGCDAFYLFGQSVSVRVSDAETGSPVAGATVTIVHDYDVGARSGEALDEYLDTFADLSDTTDAQGEAQPTVQSLGVCGGIFWFGPCPPDRLPEGVAGGDFVVRVGTEFDEEILDLLGGPGGSAQGDKFTVTISEIGAPEEILSSNG